MQEEISNLANLDLYSWREIDENCASNQIERLMSDVKQKLEVIILNESLVLTSFSRM